MTLEIGVNAYSMQSTYMRPRHHGFLYEESLREARRAEELGFDVLWMGEHHHAYDGYCPSTLAAAAFLAAGTSRIKLATGVLILPLHGAQRVAEACAAFQATAPGRLRLAVSTGYLPDELGAIGLEPKRRFAAFERDLERLVTGDCADMIGATEVFSGQSAPPGYRRAARLGLGLYMSAKTVDDYQRIREVYEADWAHARRPRITMHCETWIEEDPRKAAWVRGRLVEAWRNYAISWVDAPEGFGGERVDGFEAQWDEHQAMAERALGRSLAPIVGSPAEIVARMAPLVLAGLEGVSFRVRMDGVGGADLERCLERLAGEVVPELRRLAA